MILLGCVICLCVQVTQPRIVFNLTCQLVKFAVLAVKLACFSKKTSIQYSRILVTSYRETGTVLYFVPISISTCIIFLINLKARATELPLKYPEAKKPFSPILHPSLPRLASQHFLLPWLFLSNPSTKKSPPPFYLRWRHAAGQLVANSKGSPSWNMLLVFLASDENITIEDVFDLLGPGSIAHVAAGR